MRSLLAAIVLISMSGEAAASGSLWCDVEDKSVRLSVHGGVTRGMGGPLFSFDGQAEVRDTSAPADLRMTQFEKMHVSQYWLDGDELRLLLYQERAADKPHGYVQLTILGKAGDEESYAGRYSLELFDADASPEGRRWTYEGDITCGAE